jgi:endonuclease/exonuclease/phosphatase family metal-dependent hydrolase
VQELEAMTAKTRTWTAILLCIACVITGVPSHAQPLRVMTFNVRWPSSDDGVNQWDARRDLVVEMLRAEDPDVIGTQELYKRQGDELVARLPELTWFGESRKGSTEDEHMGVFYRKDRLKVLESGNFWLSDTPDVPGSRTWGNLFPRLVTWARFERIADGLTFTFYNTHLPYRDIDEDARIRGAQLILARLKALPGNEIVIVVGDFNAPPESRVYSTLTGAFTDAWTASAKRSGPEGTFHGFTGKPERRIDWILFRGLEPVSVETVTTNKAPRFTSDHFPVIAEFERLRNAR